MSSMKSKSEKPASSHGKRKSSTDRSEDSKSKKVRPTSDIPSWNPKEFEQALIKEFEKRINTPDFSVKRIYLI
jgi:hypothetical protein